MTTSAPQIEDLSARFRRFSEVECHGSSPLYERISLGISKDESLLKLASHSLHGPVPNLFLAAVHYLLLKEESHPVSAHYPDIVPNVVGRHDLMTQFRAFCMEKSEAIVEILQNRLVQTNEVQRSALLMPAFQFVSSKTASPLALVEIGTAAGLNLLWDEYSYAYGTGRTYGKRGSGVRIDCEVRGTLMPPVDRELPRVASRAGVDVNPLDVNDEDDVLWMKALVWPEHAKRMRLLESAVKEARKHPLKLIRDDALDALPKAMKDIPGDSALCVMSTFTLNQFTVDARGRLGALLHEEAKSRALWAVCVEFPSKDSRFPELHAVLHRDGQREDSFLAACEPHGEWLRWVKEPSL